MGKEELKEFLSNRHKQICCALKDIASLSYLRRYEPTILPQTGIQLFSLDIQNIKLSLDNYFLNINETLCARIGQLPDVVRYSIKLLDQDENEVICKFDYASSFIAEDHADKIWLDLPHIHFYHNSSLDYLTLSRVHFPTYLSPDGLGPFTHNEKFSSYHLNFMFYILKWIEFELLPRLKGETADRRKLRHADLIGSWEKIATNL